MKYLTTIKDKTTTTLRNWRDGVTRRLIGAYLQAHTNKALSRVDERLADLESAPVLDEDEVDQMIMSHLEDFATEEWVQEHLDNLPEPDVDEIAARIEVDYDEVIRNIDYSELAAEIELGDVACELDEAEIAGNLDLEEVAYNLDINHVANNLDLDTLAKEIARRIHVEVTID